MKNWWVFIAVENDGKLKALEDNKKEGKTKNNEKPPQKRKKK